MRILKKFFFLIMAMLLIAPQAFSADNNKTNASTASLDQQSALPKADLNQSSLIIPEAQTEDIERIQEELKQIISRTQQLQTQVKDDRAEVKEILERAQIHQKILSGITIPKPIQSKQQINQTDIISREKMRLIAQQARMTQEQLKVIQNSRFNAPQSPLPTDQSSKTS